LPNEIRKNEEEPPGSRDQEPLYASGQPGICGTTRRASFAVVAGICNHKTASLARRHRFIMRHYVALSLRETTHNGKPVTSIFQKNQSKFAVFIENTAELKLTLKKNRLKLSCHISR